MPYQVRWRGEWLSVAGESRARLVFALLLMRRDLNRERDEGEGLQGARHACARELHRR